MGVVVPDDKAITGLGRRELIELIRALEAEVSKGNELINIACTGATQLKVRVAELEAHVFHCPHDGAVREPAIDVCPVCGEEFTGPKGTEIKQRVEDDVKARLGRGGW